MFVPFWGLGPRSFAGGTCVYMILAPMAAKRRTRRSAGDRGMHMRTIELPVALLKRARIYPVQHDTTLRALVERGLRDILARKEEVSVTSVVDGTGSTITDGIAWWWARMHRRWAIPFRVNALWGGERARGGRCKRCGRRRRGDRGDGPGVRYGHKASDVAAHGTWGSG